MDSTSSRVYPGDGVSYRLTGAPTPEVDPGDQPPTNNGVLPNGTPIPLDVHAYVDARHYITGAPVSTKAQAIYIEDVWNVPPNLLLHLGVRADKFENALASGATFAPPVSSYQISPPVECSW